ncbi:MAG: response regulator transcription factor [Gammaproteobacteria bacterium]|nr:MAG: response regulator transcription factor [Gammaproteobacteria bacterium]
MKKIMVTYVSSRDVARQHCAALVMQNPEIDLVAIPDGLSQRGAWQAFSRSDVVVIEEEVIRREGFAAVRLLQEAYSEINVLITMADKDVQAIAWVLMQGIRGVILHSEVGSLLGKAIRRIQAGEIWAPRSLLESLRHPADNSSIADMAPQTAWILWH